MRARFILVLGLTLGWLVPTSSVAQTPAAQSASATVATGPAFEPWDGEAEPAASKLPVPRSRRDRLLLAIALALSVWLAGKLAGRVRRRLDEAGLLPRALALLSGMAGVVAGILLVWGMVAWIPRVTPEARWALVLAVVAVVVGQSWGLLSDLVAGGVLRIEGRVRSGVRLEGERFAGTVAGIDWRVTVLRTPRGRLEVPNRELLGVPVRVSKASEHVLVLVLPDRLESSTELRRRIEDAVVASAWTPPRPDVMVHRDPKDGSRWFVHCRLIDPRFAPRFDADLPERLEFLLAREDPEDSAPGPTSTPPEGAPDEDPPVRAEAKLADHAGPPEGSDGPSGPEGERAGVSTPKR